MQSVNRKDGQLAGARGEIDGGSKALKNAETQIAILRGEIETHKFGNHFFLTMGFLTWRFVNWTISLADQVEKEQMSGKSLSFALEDSKKETNLKEMMKREVEDKLSSSQGNCSGLMVSWID